MNILKTGSLIAQRRMELGMTQAELAQCLNVTDKAVSKWERGKSMPDITVLNSLAMTLRISVVELLSGEIHDAARSSYREAAVQSSEKRDYARPLSLELNTEGDILVSPYLFGSNQEHTRSCIYTGLSAQMLRNRKFVGKPSACRGCAAEWYPIGERAIFQFEQPYTRHAQIYHMQRAHECNALNIMNPRQDQEAGMGQHGLQITKDKVYTFAIVAKTRASVTLSVSLTSRSADAVYAHHELEISAPDWERFEFELTAGESDDDADLRICLTGRGSICIGAVSMMPRDNFRGMRKDVIALMKEMGITVLRWPGGNFAGEYNWMDGLLPVDMRAPFESSLGIETQPHSMGYDFHEINTDDYIALCREIGAQPFITLNPCWNTPQENAAWVEYCNGDGSTQYGRIRIERGFEEPYQVQFWSLGNEFGYGHMEGDNSPGGYCQLALENGKKMLKVTPHLSLCSSGPYPDEKWVELAAHPLSHIAQLVSLHYYGHNPMYVDETVVESEYYACLDSLSVMRQNIHALRSTLDDHIKISFDEWNVWTAWYRPTCVTEGIYAALAIHMLIDEAEKSGIALACHFESVNEGMIRVYPDRAELTAQGQVYALMKRHAGGKLRYCTEDAVATVQPDGIVTVTVINASLDEYKEVDFHMCGTCVEAALYEGKEILPPSRFTEADVLCNAREGHLRIPPHSILLMRFRQEESNCQ